MGKIFKFNGEDFEVSEPKNCRIKVVGKGLTGDIKIHEATGTYRESVMGWGSEHQTLDSALNRVCRRILDRAAKDTAGLCKGMDEFYQSLDG